MRREFKLPNGMMVVNVKPLETESYGKKYSLNLVRYEIEMMRNGTHKWVIDCPPKSRASLFDLVLFKKFQGSYLDFAQWMTENGEPGVIPNTYIIVLMDDVVIALDPPELDDNNEVMVGLYMKIAGVEYFVSVTPHTPVGLLGRTALYLRKKRGDW